MEDVSEKALLKREKDRERRRKYAANLRAKDREAYNAKMREYSARNREAINKRRRDRLASDADHAEKLRIRDRERYAKNPLGHRDKSLKSIYGITIEDYDKMYAAQSGKCWICGTYRNSGGQDGLVVDHCHNKGHVRGLLCASCNHGLGKFKDDTQRLEKAIEYLNRKG